MTGWTDDMVCYFKRLIIEGVVNEHPATCGVVYVFPSPSALDCAQHSAIDSCTIAPCRLTDRALVLLHQLDRSRVQL